MSGYCQVELELELDASADPSHPTDDNGEESYSLFHSFTTLLLKENLAISNLTLFLFNFNE